MAKLTKAQMKVADKEITLVCMVADGMPNHYIIYENGTQEYASTDFEEACKVFGGACGIIAEENLV